MKGPDRKEAIGTLAHHATQPASGNLSRSFAVCVESAQAPILHGHYD